MWTVYRYFKSCWHEMEHAQLQFPQLPELSCDVLQPQVLDATPCELVLSFHGSRDRLEGLCLYKTALF